MNILWATIFLVLFGFIMFAVALGFRILESQRKRTITKTLKTVAPEKAYTEHNILLEYRAPSESPLARVKGFRKLKVMIDGAGLGWSIEGLLVMMVVFAAIGALLGYHFRVFVFTDWSILLLAILFGALPWLFVRHRRNRRMQEFEEQFPEALDFLARAVRAGHAFSIAVEMLAREAPEPVRSEFRKVYSEMNLGASVEGALKSLMVRIPLLDVRFFVSSVLMQRNTGGNLAEILVKLSYVIRERFRLKGQVRALSAHGRITALVITLIPLAVLIGLSIIAPNYLTDMAQDEHGRWMIAYALAGQVVGYLIMRKIIDIKV